MAAADGLFPKEFIEKVRRDLPEARTQLDLAEKRIAVLKSIGGDTTESERTVFRLRNQLSQMKSAFGA